VPEPGEILRNLGINTNALERVRFAPGVVGNTTYVAAGVFGAIVAVALGLGSHAEIAETLIFGLLGFLVFYLLGTWIFAHLHPDIALLSGSELLKWRQMDMGVQGLTSPPTGPNVLPPDDHKRGPLIPPEGAGK